MQSKERRVQWYRQMAEQTRANAARTTQPPTREEFLRIAEEWEKMARDIEKNAAD